MDSFKEGYVYVQETVKGSLRRRWAVLTFEGLSLYDKEAAVGMTESRYRFNLDDTTTVRPVTVSDRATLVKREEEDAAPSSTTRTDGDGFLVVGATAATPAASGSGSGGDGGGGTAAAVQAASPPSDGQSGMQRSSARLSVSRKNRRSQKSIIASFVGSGDKYEIHLESATQYLVIFTDEEYEHDEWVVVLSSIGEDLPFDAPPTYPIAFQGFLDLRNLRHKFKRRYFVLRGQSVLIFTDKTCLGLVPKHVILLAKGAKVIPLGEDNRFTVTTVDNYHVVRAEDEDTLTAWLEVLFPFNTVGGGTPDPVAMANADGRLSSASDCTDPNMSDPEVDGDGDAVLFPVDEDDDPTLNTSTSGTWGNGTADDSERCFTVSEALADQMGGPTFSSGDDSDDDDDDGNGANSAYSSSGDAAVFNPDDDPLPPRGPTDSPMPPRLRASRRMQSYSNPQSNLIPKSISERSLPGVPTAGGGDLGAHSDEAGGPLQRHQTAAARLTRAGDRGSGGGSDGGGAGTSSGSGALERVVNRRVVGVAEDSLNRRARALSQGASVLQCGFLLKKGQARRNWKKRWFVLTPELLSYYEGNPLERSGSLYLKGQLMLKGGFRTCVIDNAKQTFKFAVILSTRVLELRAATAEERDQWMDTLDAIGGERTPTAAFAIEKRSRWFFSKKKMAPLTLDGDEVMSGWLEKKGRKRHSWKRRWCVCFRDRLVYMVEEGNPTTIKGELRLTPDTRVTPDNTYGEYRFLVATTSRDILFRAASEEERLEWVTTIKSQTQDKRSVSISRNRNKAGKRGAGVATTSTTGGGGMRGSGRLRSQSAFASLSELRQDPVFGVDLSELISRYDPRDQRFIPIFLERCSDVVRMNRDYPGLFRHRVNDNMVASVRKEFDHFELFDFESLELSPDIIAEIIKVWFAELPEPILTYALYNHFRDADNVTDETERLQSVHRFVHILPRENYEVLKLLISILKEVADGVPEVEMELAAEFASAINRNPDENVIGVGVSALPLLLIRSFEAIFDD